MEAKLKTPGNSVRDIIHHIGHYRPMNLNFVIKDCVSRVVYRPVSSSSWGSVWGHVESIGVVIKNKLIEDVL